MCCTTHHLVRGRDKKLKKWSVPFGVMPFTWHSFFSFSAWDNFSPSSLWSRDNKVFLWGLNETTVEVYWEHECETTLPLSLPSFKEIGIHVTAYNLVSSWNAWGFKEFKAQKNQLWQRGLETIDVELKTKGWAELGRVDMGRGIEAGRIPDKENEFRTSE